MSYNSFVKPKIIYEDNYLYILDKPSGWITNDSETTRDQPVVQNWLSNNFSYPIVINKMLRSGIVHRLDKETSGVLLVAKTVQSFNFLQDQFKKRMVNKEYLALAHGRIEPYEGDIEVPVGRLPWMRKKFGILPGGRESKTSYRATSFYRNQTDTFTYVTLKPKTGRTHQIRIHLKYLNHPIVSDELYAGRKTSRIDRKWCPRLFLHARSISFTHPVTGKVIESESGLPSDLKNALTSLEKIVLRI